MSTVKLTEKPVAEAAADDLKLVITQTEESAGADEVVVRRIRPDRIGLQTALPQKYLDYLDNATYLSPAILALTSSPSLGGDAEIGTSISVASVSHQESNVGNIVGTLTLKHGNATVQAGIAPSATAATVTLTSPEVITRTSAGTETLTLSGADSKSKAFTKSISKAFYVPKFLGSGGTTVTAQDILGFSKGKSMPTTLTLSAPAYFYFVSDTTIAGVKYKSGGFGVPLESPVMQTVSVNGVNVSYRVYRSSMEQQAGTYQFIIE